MIEGCNVVVECHGTTNIQTAMVGNRDGPVINARNHLKVNVGQELICHNKGRVFRSNN